MPIARAASPTGAAIPCACGAADSASTGGGGGQPRDGDAAPPPGEPAPPLPVLLLLLLLLLYAGFDGWSGLGRGLVALLGSDAPVWVEPGDGSGWGRSIDDRGMAALSLLTSEEVLLGGEAERALEGRECGLGVGA